MILTAQSSLPLQKKTKVKGSAASKLESAQKRAEEIFASLNNGKKYEFIGRIWCTKAFEFMYNVGNKNDEVASLKKQLETVQKELADAKKSHSFGNT